MIFNPVPAILNILKYLSNHPIVLLVTILSVLLVILGFYFRKRLEEKSH